MNERFFVVHNGIIENYAEIKKELIEQGFIFRSQTDTEVIAQLFQSLFNGDPKETLEKMIKKIGSTPEQKICP